MSVREYAALLRVSTATVYKAVAAGGLSHVRVSSVIRIPVLTMAKQRPRTAGRDTTPAVSHNNTDRGRGDV